MPEIFVYMFEGRTMDQKRALVSELTAGTARALGVTPDSVAIQLIENPKSMRSRGGVLFSDIAPQSEASKADSPSSP